MNDMNAVPPRIPPQITVPSMPGLPPLGESVAEQTPISNLLAAIEAVLREPRRVIYQLRQPGAGRLAGTMMFGALLCSLIYGAVVGSFSMGPQLWIAPVKIAVGLLLSAVVCLPSLYIFACLGGSRARLLEIIGLVAGMLMLMTVLLIGFAPVAWLFSQSTESATWMGTLHLGFCFVATCFGLRFLYHGFSHSQARSAAGLNTWIIIFLLVALQMTTALRPLLGRAETFLPTEKRFFPAYWVECLRGTAPESH
jgi:hypothetical protein